MDNAYFFRFEIQDFIDAENLVRNNRLPSASRVAKLFGIFLVVLFAVLAAIFLFFNLLSLISSGFVPRWTIKGITDYLLGFKDGWLFLSCYLVPLLLVFLTEALVRFRFWSMVRNNPDIIQEERKFFLSPLGISFSTPSRESTFSWDYFEHALEGRNHFVLEKTKDNYVIVPKRAFSEPAGEGQFRELVSSKIGSIINRS